MSGKLFSALPDPFTDTERDAFARRVKSALPRRRASLAPILALAATTLVTAGVVLLTLTHTPPAAAPARTAVENPLQLADAVRPETPPAVTPAPPVPKGPVLEDVAFAIAKTDHRVMLTWQGDEGTRYLVQKCLLSSNGKVCRTEAVVTGGRFEDPSREEAPLVLYTVEAIRS